MCWVCLLANTDVGLVLIADHLAPYQRAGVGVLTTTDCTWCVCAGVHANRPTDWHHALLSLLSALCSLLSALCSLLPAPCSLLPAPCSLLPAPCSLLSAPCSLLPALCSLLAGLWGLGSTLLPNSTECMARTRVQKLTTDTVTVTTDRPVVLTSWDRCEMEGPDLRQGYSRYWQ